MGLEVGAEAPDAEKDSAAADLAGVLALSRDEAEELPLSWAGVTLFRLTRNHRSSEVVSLLMKPQGALAYLYRNTWPHYMNLRCMCVM